MSTFREINRNSITTDNTVAKIDKSLIFFNMKHLSNSVTNPVLLI